MGCCSSSSSSSLNGSALILHLFIHLFVCSFAITHYRTLHTHTYRRNIRQSEINEKRKIYSHTQSKYFACDMINQLIELRPILTITKSATQRERV